MNILNFNGLKNARDIANSNIKQNRLIRSEALTKLTKKDVETLKNDINLKVVIDLRTPEELKNKDVIIPDVEYINLPMTTNKELGMTREDPFFKTFKKEKVFPDLNETYKKMFLFDKESFWHKLFDIFSTDYNGAILWHCSAGKDRCGIVSAILEYCLGYSQSEIINDYMYTNNSPVFHTKYKILHAFLPKRLKTQFKELFFVKEEYLYSAYEAINKLYGNIDNFLKTGCGLNSEKLLKIKKIYLK